MVAIHLQEPLLFPPSPVQIRNKKAKGQEMKELVEEVWGGGGVCREVTGSSPLSRMLRRNH